MKTKYFIIRLILALSFSCVTVHADKLITTEGAILIGTIKLIDEGKVILLTDYAGELTIDQSKVVSFSSDQPLTLRLASGTTMAGIVKSSKDGTISISNDDGYMHTTVTKIIASWISTAENPDRVRDREEREALKRNWKFSTELNVGGRMGNTESFDIGTKLTAVLKSPDDELKFYFRTTQSEREGTKIVNETIAGARYTSYFTKKYGWYVREEIERDEFEGVDFRSISAAGITRSMWDIPNRSKLNLSLGIAYRYDSLTNGEIEQAPALDLGLDYEYQYNDIFTIDTSLSVVPSMEETSNYLIYHDSGINVPVNQSKTWTLRLGVSNTFNGNPSVGKTALDTMFYTGLLLSWD